MNWKVKKCNVCKIKKNIYDREKIKCFWCYMKDKHKIPNYVTIAEAQEKIRKVCNRAYKMKIRCFVNLPPCYLGKKVKVVVLDEKGS